MPFLKNVFVCCCLLAVTVSVTAQNTRQVKPKEKPVQKFTPPKLKTALGKYSDSAVNVSADEALQLIELPLTITDDKKTAYAISSYQCLYKKRGVTEDEQTGKVSPVTSVVAQVFKTTPISEIWRKSITEQLKSGEEIFFFDVVVKDTQGHLMFAPNIKLVIK
ncbi:hypothetical protein [Ferruginibacter sp.]